MNILDSYMNKIAYVVNKSRSLICQNNTVMTMLE